MIFIAFIKSFYEKVIICILNALSFVIFLVMYDAPCYIYPDRSGGQGRPPYVVTVELKPGAETVDHWIQRGVAVLMSLAT